MATLNRFKIIVFLVVTFLTTTYGKETTISSSTGHTDQPQPGYRKRCENGWVRLDDKCLKLRYIEETFADANTICQNNYQATLLIISSIREQNILEQLFIETASGNQTYSTGNFLYMGGVRCPHKNEYSWIGTNEIQFHMNYTNWDTSQPTISITLGCLGWNLGSKYSTTYNYGKWHAVGCGESRKFVCEKSAQSIF